MNDRSAILPQPDEWPGAASLAVARDDIPYDRFPMPEASRIVVALCAAAWLLIVTVVRWLFA